MTTLQVMVWTKPSRYEPAKESLFYIIAETSILDERKHHLRRVTCMTTNNSK